MNSAQTATKIFSRLMKETYCQRRARPRTHGKHEHRRKNRTTSFVHFCARLTRRAPRASRILDGDRGIELRCGLHSARAGKNGSALAVENAHLLGAVAFAADRHQGFERGEVLQRQRV